MEPEHFEALYPEETRFAEIEKVMHFIKEGGSCQILGVPGVSRSTLLNILAYNRKVRAKHLGVKQKRTQFVLVNFSEIRKRPLFDAMKFLFLSLASSLHERRMMEEYEVVTGLFRESLSFHDELVLFQGLKDAIDYLALEKRMHIVFLFDRFEEYIPTVTTEFFNNLRILRNRAKFQFSIVFSLNRPLELMLEPNQLADFYEFVAGHLVYLQLFDKASTDFRIAYIEKITGTHLTENMHKEIVSLTGGHSKLTKLAVEAALANGVNENELAGFLPGQKAIRGALMEIWLSLSPAEQSDLLQGTFEDQQVRQYLEAVGLIKNDRLQIPLFEQFLHSEFVKQEEKQPQGIVYDQNTNTIRKGAAILSDQLTASEFRLLRYFLQNQERIIEREEIIAVVWQNVKSTAGITDQAIDQLIFRVRRKIEEDPISPVQKETENHRHFRFVA